MHHKNLNSWKTMLKEKLQEKEMELRVIRDAEEKEIKLEIL